VLVREEPGQQISHEEFQELVRDLDVDQPPVGVDGETAARGGRAARSSQRGGVAARAAEEAAEEQQARPDPAADLTPEDLVLKEAPKRREKRRRPRNRRHGRSR